MPGFYFVGHGSIPQEQDSIPGWLKAAGRILRPMSRVPLQGWLASKLVNRVRGRGYAGRVTIRGGIALFLDLDDFVPAFAFFGAYEPGPTRFLQRNLGPGDTFVDVGAHIGYYTTLAAKCVGPKGSVMAFEAVTPTFERLKTNVEANHFECVRLNHAVVHEDGGTHSVYYAEASNTGRSRLSERAPGLTGTHEEVEGTSLDQYWKTNRLGAAHLVKIDAEGSEISVLRGMREIIQQWHPKILVEVSEVNLREQGGSAAALFEMLRGIGYEPKAIRSNGSRAPAPGTSFEGDLVLFEIPLADPGPP